MEYLHIKNLEKHHSGYKDRPLRWAKIHIAMVQGDPKCEMVTDEIDWGRLIKFILLELQAQEPIPLDPVYLVRKGFDLKRRPISKTLSMLQDFIEIVTQPLRNCNESVEQSRVDKSRVDKSRDSSIGSPSAHLTDDAFLSSLKKNPAYSHIDLDRELAKMDAWLLTHRGRKKTRRFIVNWLNKIDKPLETTIEDEFDRKWRKRK